MDSVEAEIIESSQTVEMLQGKGKMVLTNNFEYVFYGNECVCLNERDRL